MAKFSDQDRESSLKAHNKARADVNLPPLTYDHDLASHAQSYAQHLARTGTFKHHPQRMQGENLFVGFGQTFGVANGTKYWIDEKKHIKNGRATGDVGHYTEIIYPPVTKVGFGLAQGHRGTYVVARYDKIQDSNWMRQALTLKTNPSSAHSNQTQQQQQQQNYQQQPGGFPFQQLGGQRCFPFQQIGAHGHQGAHGGHAGQGGHGAHIEHQYQHQHQLPGQIPPVPWYSGTQKPSGSIGNPGHGGAQQRQGGHAEFLRRLNNNASFPQQPNQGAMGGRGSGCANCANCAKCPDRRSNSR